MKQRTRILIYILVAIAVVIMGSMAIINNHQADKPVSAQEHIDLGHTYLIELSYDKAVIEFTEAIEIEPLNPDAYLGLAEAYVGIGDTEKAIEVLEDGYDKTGDERLKAMLEELLPHEPEVTTATTTEATTTAILKKDCTVKVYAHRSEYWDGESRGNEDYPYKDIIYDSNGHVTRTVEYFNRGYSDGPYKLILEYDNNNNICTSRIFDKDGNAKTIGYGDKYFNLDYKNIYDNNHIIMTEITEPKNVYSTSDCQVYMYNSLGLSTDKVTIDYNPFKNSSNSYIQLVASLTGAMSSNYRIEKWEHYEYNSKGKIIREFGFNQSDDYTYDVLLGYWTEILKPRYREFYNYKDLYEYEGVKKESYVYDNLTGALSSINIFKPDNDTEIPYYIKWIDDVDTIYNFAYDENSVTITSKNPQNKTGKELCSYSLNGLDRKYINSINYLIDYTYDSDNQLIKETKYKFNCLKGFSLDETIEYKYDFNGDLITEKCTMSYGSVYEYNYTYDYVNK